LPLAFLQIYPQVYSRVSGGNIDNTIYSIIHYDKNFTSTSLPVNRRKCAYGRYLPAASQKCAQRQRRRYILKTAAGYAAPALKAEYVKLFMLDFAASMCYNTNII
jgi:hypothetical protein